MYVPDMFTSYRSINLLQAELHPSKAWTPGAYTPLEIKKTTHPCGISDVIDFIFDYVSIHTVVLLFDLHS